MKTFHYSLAILLAVLTISGTGCSILPHGKPVMTLVLRADTSKLPKGEKWDASKIKKELSVLQIRANSGGCRGTASLLASGEFVVNLYRVPDPNKVVEYLTAPGRMEFRSLDGVHLEHQLRVRPEDSTYTLYSETATGRKQNTIEDSNGKDVTAQVLAKSPIVLTNEDIEPPVRIEKDNSSYRPMIAFSFKREGKFKFADFTTRNVDRILAIALDGRMLTAPTIREPILDGKAVINGELTREEAVWIAAQLNSGALPVPLKVIDKSPK